MSDGQMQEIRNFYASMQEKNGASLYQRCYEKCGFTIYDEMYKNGNRTSDVQAAQRFHDRISEPFKRIENERSPGNRCFKLLPGEFCTLNSFFLKKCKIG